MVITGSPDTVVIGAGFAGLALACRLAEHGRPPGVLERRPELPRSGAGIILQPNGLAALDRLGLIDAVVDRGTRIDRATLRDQSDRILVSSDYTRLRHPHPYLVEIRRIDLLEALSERFRALGGSPPLTGRELTGLTRDGDRVTGLRYRDGEAERELSCGLVVGADGAGSRVRSELGIAVRRSGAADRYVVGIAKSPGIAVSDMRVYFGPGYGNGVAPLGKDIYFWDHVTPENEEAVEAGDLYAWGELYARRVPLGTEIVAALDSFDELTVLTGRTRQVAERIADGAALAGDAAGTVHPHAGQGANLALEDAVALGDVLAELDDEPVTRRALERYARPRQRKARMYIAWSGLAARTFDAPTPFWRMVRRLNSYSTRLPFVQRATLRTMAGLRGP